MSAAPPVAKPRSTTVSESQPETTKPTSSAPPLDDEPAKLNSKLVCHSCGATVAYKVAKFCWFNKARFGGNVFCMDYQKKL